MEWNKVPQILKDRYEKISTFDCGKIKFLMLEAMNKDCLPVNQGVDSRSYEVFATQFNSTMLTAHLFENLFSFEDKRHELTGNQDFEFNIPELYFRHPSLNKSPQFTDIEKCKISLAVKLTKERMNFSKDGSFVLSQLHKLEFISNFSYLEAYVESLMVEFLDIDKKKASEIVSKKALPKLIEDTLSKINPNIIDIINKVEPDAIKFISLCRKVRNLHMHDLGIVTQRFFDECAKEGLFCYDIYTETSQPVTEYARPNFKFYDYIIKVGKPINLSGVSQPFRLLSREIVFISEAFCKEKMKEWN